MNPHAVIAASMIAELERTREVLDYYLAHPNGDCDFVWIEEGISAALTRAGISQEFYLATVARVFEYLRETYDVTPPAWFLREHVPPSSLALDARGKRRRGFSTRCTNSPACAARGCADCERSYGPAGGAR